MDRVKGKVAIVTGAAGGLGSALCSRFFEEGANLVLFGRDADISRRGLFGALSFLLGAPRFTYLHLLTASRVRDPRPPVTVPLC